MVASYIPNTIQPERYEETCLRDSPQGLLLLLNLQLAALPVGSLYCIVVELIIAFLLKLVCFIVEICRQLILMLIVGVGGTVDPFSFVSTKCEAWLGFKLT